MRTRTIGRVTAIFLVGMLAGTMLISPAGAHIGSTKHLINKHLKKVFYTKAQSNKRFVHQLRYVRSAAVAVSNGGFGRAEANCPAGWVATGGGGTSFNIDVRVITSIPSGGAGAWFDNTGFTSWLYEVQNLGGGSTDIRAYVICASPNSIASNYGAGLDPAATDVGAAGGREG